MNTENLDSLLTSIANAIRTKEGTTKPIQANEFDNKISDIPSVRDYVTDSISGKFIKSIKKIPKLNIEGTSLRGAFSELSSLTTIPQLDTSNVTSMYEMLTNCSSLTTIPQLDTSNVTEMLSMFQGCSSLTSLPELNLASATITSQMFNGCRLLKSVSLLNTSNVTKMSSMFSGCISLISISELDADSLTNITSMFYGCYNLEKFGGLKNVGKAYSNNVSSKNSSYSIDLSHCTKLTHGSLMNVINDLYDIKIKGCPVQRLILGTENKNKLTAEEIAIATNKGWTVE